ncbi:MAG TPA: T9SS type A sorting domain-containing protein [Bacteroidia bacterium]|jgi:hypothetical protein|nr:T9SS type A sorting domain-containing protein [Bacteroidia bacterium]
MIKQLLSTLFFTTTTLIVSAQCTPDVSCIPSGTAYGICPDSATGLKKGFVNMPYTETISIKIPATTDAFGVSGGTVNSIKIDSVVGLEPNLTYQCSAANCTYPGNSTGCALISGTPTQGWDKPIVVKVTADITVAIFNQKVQKNLTGYRCIVNYPTGIENLSPSKFEVGQNSPNPVTGKSEIHFSVVNNENVDFKVYNMLGAVVFSANYKAERGNNTITIEANSFAPGVYIYSIGNATQTITKRMIVSR